VPLRVTAARVGINAALIKVGLARNGTIGVPPLNDALKAAWFDRGPAPGQIGPAVIDAHVDSLDVPDHRAAFYSLGALRPGDQVEVTRSDHQVAVFTVDSVELVSKREFPTSKVYGALPYAGLRLITCGGEFRRGEGYLGNVIVYAHLTGRRSV
jgi:sortase (surface protein transpeptidase)